MLALVGTCCVYFETGQTFRPMQTDATLLANNTQHCWELLALVASVCMGLKEDSRFIPAREIGNLETNMAEADLSPTTFTPGHSLPGQPVTLTMTFPLRILLKMKTKIHTLKLPELIHQQT